MPKKIPPRIIRIKVESTNKKELKSLARNMGLLNKSVKQTAKNTRFLADSLKFSFLGFGIREVVRLNDQFNLLTDRIKVFTGDAVSAEEAFNKLFATARKTRTSTTSLAETFNRVALATQELGLNTEEILGVTEALQQTFRLSGATIAEATAATIQLSQGLSSGQLRGQELRSVLEQNAVFVNLLSEELGVARGQLIKFAETGGITSEVVLATLAKNFEKISEQADNLGTTIGQALTIGIDALIKKFNEFDKAIGLSSGLAKSLVFVAENLGHIASVVGLIVGAAYLPRLIVLVNELNIALTSGALLKFFKALNPIVLLLGSGAIAVGVAEAVNNAIPTKFQLKELDRLNRKLKRLKMRLDEAKKSRDDYAKASVNAAKATGIGSAAQTRALADFNKANAVYNNFRKAVRDTEREIQKLNDTAGRKNPLGRFAGKKGAKEVEFNLKAINDELKRGEITYEEYTNKIDGEAVRKLNKDFADGKINVEEYVGALTKIPQAASASQVATLGLNNAIESMGDTLSLATGIFTQTFQGIEDAMVEFATNGKFVWRDFVNAIIKEIIRLAIRATVIKPILQAISGFSFGSNVATGIPNAGAGIPDLVPKSTIGSVAVPGFAKGGAFDGAQLGVFGEAGPEAILPLTRGSGGELGVKAVGAGGGETIINVFNNGDNQVETKETTGPNGEKQIDIMIASKVKGLFQSGAMDRQMSANYGLKRKGT